MYKVIICNVYYIAAVKRKRPKKKSSFDSELTSTGQRAVKKFRAG